MITIGQCKNWTNKIQPIFTYQNGIEEGTSPAKTEFIYNRRIFVADPMQEMESHFYKTLRLFI